MQNNYPSSLLEQGRILNSLPPVLSAHRDMQCTNYPIGSRLEFLQKYSLVNFINDQFIYMTCGLKLVPMS